MHGGESNEAQWHHILVVGLMTLILDWVYLIGCSKGAFLIEAKQLVFCEVIFVYLWNYFHANVWQNVKDLTPYFDRQIY